MCTGEESSGFIGLNTLRRKSVLIYSSTESQSQLRVLPSMNFSCSGTISRWTFVAWKPWKQRNGDQYPIFQLWRPNGTEGYERVHELSTNRVSLTAQRNSRLTIAEYVPAVPIPFEPGDVLGVYQFGNSRLGVIHVDVPSGFGRVNFVRNTDVPVFDTTTSGVSAGNDFPLVAVSTSKNRLWCMGSLVHVNSGRIILHLSNIYQLVVSM